LATCLALLAQKSPDLALVVKRWDSLPAPLRGRRRVMNCINLLTLFGNRYRISFDEAYNPRNVPRAGEASTFRDSLPVRKSCSMLGTMHSQRGEETKGAFVADANLGHSSSHQVNAGTR
jgi:hypothetical protein